MKATSSLLLLVLLATACHGLPGLQPATLTPSPSPVPTLALGSARELATRFGQAWSKGDWEAMYQLLAPQSKQSISFQDFSQRYQDVHREATVLALRAEVAELTADPPQQVSVRLRVTFDTMLVGQVEAYSRLRLIWDGRGWAVAWSPEAILEDLQEGLLVKLTPVAPQRGNIYARDGSGLALQGKLITVGVVPCQIQDEEKLLATLSRILDMPKEAIQQKYARALQKDWFMPVADITPEQSVRYQEELAALPGVQRQEKWVRTYPQGTLAGHIVGYTGKISPEQLEQLGPLGYGPDDIVGKAGIERWAERYLSGRRGGTLSIVAPDGRTVKVIKYQRPPPSQSVYLTLDAHLQEAAHKALGDRVGAVVAMDPFTGEILALVSHPTVDANALSGGMSGAQWQALLDDPRHPLVNRATQGQYPPGSVFKVVTMAAGLEEAGLSAESPFYCAGSWDGLHDSLIRHCWWASGHGSINLRDGLTQSCDIVFYEVGKALHDIRPELLSEYARRFGLGSPTGLQGLDELPGLVPDPQWKAAYRDTASNPFWTAQDTVNLAIGQGYLLVTPLQAARLMAAVANGGVLYAPRIMRQIMSLAGGDVLLFETQEVGRLPASKEHLALIREALRAVCMSPSGTAYPAFQGVKVPMAGKTGTAETGRPGETHAWFVGYAPADEPRIVVAVVVEFGGEGSSVAAPIFRQVVESYLGLGGN